MDLGKMVRETSSGVDIDIIVTPGSSASEVQGIEPWRKRLIVKVRAPPEGGRANEEAVDILQAFFKGKVVVTHGHTQRMKVVSVELPMKMVIERIMELG